jgi:hypothetical protein
MEALAVDLWKAVDEMQVQAPQMPAPQQQAQPKVGPVFHRGALVHPGELVGIKGPIAGQKFHVLHRDNSKNLLTVIPHGASMDSTPKTFRGKDEFTQFNVTREPKFAHDNTLIDSTVHGLPHLMASPEQHSLIHGLEIGQPHAMLGTEPGVSEKSGRAGWHQGPKGRALYLKRSEPTEFSESHREAAYHNLAHSVFGMGHYLPTTAAFVHPSNGHHYAAVDRLDGAEHLQFHASTGAMLPHQQETLRALGDSGELDKMALMNSIMGNDDRHNFNFMFTPKDKTPMKLIDHGYAFMGHHRYETMLPSYWTHYHQNSKIDASNTPLHPEALKWLQGLDAKKLRDEATKLRIPVSHITELTHRLNTMQNLVRNHPSTPKYQVHDAPVQAKEHFGDPSME